MYICNHNVREIGCTMDYVKELEKYAPAHTDAQIAKEIAKIKMAANRNGNADVYKFCYSAIDLTTLS